MPVPTVLLVGFLGAGKTTFLREILPQLEERGLVPYVLINDYQNARVDASSLRHLTDEVRAINGNCVCCDSIHELINDLLAIPETPDRVVLIEANGTTDPFSLIEHLTAHLELRQRFAPIIQVGFVDLRVKGVCQLLELPDIHFVFQRTDDTPPQPTMFPLLAEPTVPPCAILIGVRLAAEEIQQAASAKFGIVRS
ncbi:MAG: GTP-binding protein [Chthoniobacterales bacterium]